MRPGAAPPLTGGGWGALPPVPAFSRDSPRDISKPKKRGAAQGGLRACPVSGDDRAMTTERPEYLTVRELADLLRLKERKVYDLAASGKVPCSRATGKLLFPEAEIRAWIAGHSTGQSAARPAIFLGSHDPLLEWALRQSQCGLASFLDGSLDGLDRFDAGEGIATGLHVHDAASGAWNVPAVQGSTRNAVLLGWAMRQRGLVLGADAPQIAGIGDLAGLRIAPRQPESGTDILFRTLLDSAGIAPETLTLTEAARSETDAVLAVAQGHADATFGLRAVAAPYGLRFVPLVEERFDILADRRAYFEPPMQAFWAFTRTDAFRAQAEALQGYDLSGLGAVRWNA